MIQIFIVILKCTFSMDIMSFPTESHHRDVACTHITSTKFFIFFIFFSSIQAVRQVIRETNQSDTNVSLHVIKDRKSISKHVGHHEVQHMVGEFGEELSLISDVYVLSLFCHY